ncbi:MAG: hypothetical protein AMS24_01500 [Chlamydiae bacterium SM23_39]|nr:MAG: hypothetical protein AMS24_01500 [Chlamydiae bacterium SM23_39]
MRTVIICLLFFFKIFGEFSWSLPSKILSPAGSNASSPQVKMDNYGNVICLWLRSYAGKKRIERTISNDYGVSWNDNVFITSETIDVVYFKLAMNDSGQISLCCQPDPGMFGSNLYAYYSIDYGLTWNYSTSLDDSADNLSMSMDKYGKVLVAYDRVTNIMVRVSSSYNGGKNWHIGVHDTTGDRQIAKIVMNDNNQAVLLYQETFFAKLCRSYATYTTSWHFSSEFIFSEAAPGGDLKMNDSGFVIYSSCKSGVHNESVELHSTDAGENFSSLYYLSELGFYVQLDSQRCAIDQNGYASVVWEIFDGANNIVQERHTTDYGNSWSESCYLSEEGQSAWDTVISSDKFGNTFVSWYRSNGTNNIRQVRWTLDKGNTWSEILDASEAGQNAGVGDMAMNLTGYVMLTFLRSDGSHHLVNIVTGSWYDSSIGIKTNLIKENIDFFLTRELICNLEWNDNPFAVKYNLYKDKDLTILLSSTTKLQYPIHNAKIGNRYFLTWEDYMGEQRDKTTIFVK